MMSSRRALSWETAESLVVFLMICPSGSFHDAFLLEPWCLMSIWDALTWFPADEDIFVLLVFRAACLFSLSLSVWSDAQIKGAAFLRLCPDESIFAAQTQSFDNVCLSVVCTRTFYRELLASSNISSKIIFSHWYETTFKAELEQRLTGLTGHAFNNVNFPRSYSNQLLIVIDTRAQIKFDSF